MRNEFAGLKLSCLVTVIMLAIGLNISLASKLWSESSETDDKPAVSKLNAKIDGGYADFDADSIRFGASSVIIPLGHRFGLSIDGLGGDYSADSLWGAGGTLFWRNPDKGLLGIMGSNVNVGGVKAYRGGVTGELYLGPFSVLTDVGYLNGDTIKAGVFADLQFRWYALDNLALSAGGAYANNIAGGGVSMEYMPVPKVLPGLTLFVNGNWGEEGHHAVMAGARYYFGGVGKTLKEKHREDDPPNAALTGMILCSQGDCFRQQPPSGGDDDIVDDDVVDDIVDDDIVDDIADDIVDDIGPV